MTDLKPMKSILKSDFQCEASFLNFNEIEIEIWAETNMISFKEYLKSQKANILYETYPNDIFEDFCHYKNPESKCHVVWEINFGEDPLKNNILQLQKDFSWFGSVGNTPINKKNVGIVIFCGDKNIFQKQIESLDEEIGKMERRAIIIFILHQEGLSWEMARIEKQNNIEDFTMITSELILNDLNESKEKKAKSFKKEKNEDINTILPVFKTPINQLIDACILKKEHENEVGKLKINNEVVEKKMRDLEEENKKLVVGLNLANKENKKLKKLSVIFGFLLVLLLLGRYLE